MTTLLIAGLLLTTPATDRPNPAAPTSPPTGIFASALTAATGPLKPTISLTPALRLTPVFAPQAPSMSALSPAQFRPGSGSRKPSTAKRIVGSIAGAVGGFFLGGYAGAAIEGDSCGCDDPGLKGFIIGAPIGAVAGGILGALWK